MRVVPFIISAIITISLVVTLNSRLSVNGGKTPRLGFFLSPQTGFWQNAESESTVYNADIKLPELSGKTEVYFDERLVPHVYAENENDAWFVQGYLHAKFRLWQMDFQTYAAAGRLSEIMGATTGGTNFLGIDKFFRRLGMVSAAENSLQEIEADPETKATCDAYTAGVNAYISTLKEKDYPVEYKLLDYKPEPWTNLKSALFLKYMSFDLAGYEEDFEKTNAKSYFTKEQYDALFPLTLDSVHPIVPNTTVAYPKTNLTVTPPAGADSAYYNYKQPAVPENTAIKPNKHNGSNNWAVAGSKTASGRPILCNDPHLSLNFPSLWYEMQITTPSFNAYGVSFPGAPCVIIGFNDSCAFGFTNAERDVRDYYEIEFEDSTMQHYRFNGVWQQTAFRDEIIKVRNGANDTEHIAITLFGPVMYDHSYPDKLNSGKYYACRWKAHEKSNELRTFYKLDHAKNYTDYNDAISTYACPGQNMIFATTSGDIAIKEQAKFPAKWFRQGDFIMPGKDSSYMWQGNIPDTLNIALRNPANGYVYSANQYPYNPLVYPYYLQGTFDFYRSWIINRDLQQMQHITTDDMEKMQTSNYNIMAEQLKPLLLKYVDAPAIGDNGQKYMNMFLSWNLNNDAGETGATVYELWKDSLMNDIYGDEFAQSHLPMPWPHESVMVQGIAKDSMYSFADDINTPGIKETVKDIVTKSFKQIVPVLAKADSANTLAWGMYKEGRVTHLLHLNPFSSLHVNAGGGEGIINAFTVTHGPSWRMVVELTDQVNAYGVYPGGQSGNPGSKYYDMFVNDWAQGKYYKLRFVKKDDMAKEISLTGKMTFSKS